MNPAQERLIQALIRAAVSAVLAAIAVLAAFVVSPAFGTGLTDAGLPAWFVPTVVGGATFVLQAIAKYLGGVTTQPSASALRSASADHKRPNILAL